MPYPAYVTGDEGTRTLDLRIANATLSQLSYVPMTANHRTSLPGPVNNRRRERG